MGRAEPSAVPRARLPAGHRRGASLSGAGELAALARLNSLGVRPDVVRGWLSAAGLGAAAWLDASPEDWAAAVGGDAGRALELRRRALDFPAERELERLAELGGGLSAAGDPAYPALLASIADAPLALYRLGPAPDRLDAVALVGSRQATPYGRRMARLLARQASASGWAVVSGLARGVDAEAHRAVLEAGGLTWAALGSGLCRPYPPENRGLAERIAASGGCVLSELPLDAPPLAGNFPRRNRIVSGLSRAVVVVEGAERSGALITARCAAEQGREVLAVPGPADSPMSAAPHILLGRGAGVATGFGDVLEALGLGGSGVGNGAGDGDRSLGPPAPTAGGPAVLLHSKILQSLGFEARPLEELASELDLPLPVVSAALSELEIEGLAAAVEGQRYART